MKKILIMVLSLIVVLCSACFFACGGNDVEKNKSNNQTYAMYTIYKAYAEEKGETPLSYEEWIDSVKGADGKDGVGISSITINENGDLIVTLTDNTVINAGKVKDVHSHELVEKEIVERKPTCKETGLKYIVCETCGELLKTIITDKASHDYSKIVTAPTCTEQGYTTYTCSVCGFVEIGNYTEPTGHSYRSDYTFDDNYHWKEPTCGHADAIVKQAHTFNQDEVCTVCGYDLKVTLSLTYVEVNDGTEYAVDELTDDSVKIIYIPDEYNGKPVTKINDMVFEGNATIKKVVMGCNIIDIGNYTFRNCSSLTSVTIPDSVTSIGEGAFYDCSSLTSITIPDSVTNIGMDALSYCSSLTSITIPDSVTSIGGGAFV